MFVTQARVQLVYFFYLKHKLRFAKQKFLFRILSSLCPRDPKRDLSPVVQANNA